VKRNTAYKEGMEMSQRKIRFMRSRTMDN